MHERNKDISSRNMVKISIGRALFPTWKVLNNTAGSGLARAAMLIPVIGYLIVLNGNVINYLGDRGVISASTIISAGPQAKVYLLYFGLVLIAISSFMFNNLKPNNLNLGKDEYDYIRHEEDIINSSNDLYDRYLRRMKEEVTFHFQRAQVWQSDERTRMRERLLKYIQEAQEIRGRSAPKREISRDRLYDYYSLMINSRPVSRLCIRLIFITGTMLALAPAVDTFITVCRMIFIDLFYR